MTYDKKKFIGVVLKRLMYWALFSWKYIFFSKNEKKYRKYWGTLNFHKIEIEFFFLCNSKIDKTKYLKLTCFK